MPGPGRLPHKVKMWKYHPSTRPEQQKQQPGAPGGDAQPQPQAPPAGVSVPPQPQRQPQQAPLPEAPMLEPVEVEVQTVDGETPPPPDQRHVAEPPAEQAERFAFIKEVHRQFLIHYGEQLLRHARAGFVDHGRGALCLRYGAIVAALEGRPAQPVYMIVADAVAAAKRATGVDQAADLRQRLEAYDPTGEAVLVLFGPDGDLHQSTIRMHADAAPPATS